MKKHLTGGPSYLTSDLLFPFRASEWSHCFHCLFFYFFFIYLNVFRGQGSSNECGDLILELLGFVTALSSPADFLGSLSVL